MSADEEKSLEILKQIFLKDNNKKLDEFEEELHKLRLQLTDKETQIATFYPVITDLLERTVTKQKSEIATVLSPVIGPAIKQQITESRDDVIDALYPIMGETIKKSVAESMKELYNSLNQKIEAALTRGLFSKKLKSTISGVSTGDLIMQGAFPFEIKEIFYIHETSGILITHISSLKNKVSVDGDLISGMLTAIKNFVADSFQSDSGSQNLYEIQYGDNRIILERGRYSYLAVVVSGNEPSNFHEELTELNLTLHKKYHKKLRKFSGDISQLSNVENPIREFLNLYEIETTEQVETKSTPYLLYLFYIILAITLIIIGIFTLPKYFRDKNLSEKVEENLEILPKLETENLKWNVDNSKINITGTVPSIAVKKKIDSLMNSIEDHQEINNNLGVIFYILPEDSIRKNIKNQLSKFYDGNNFDISYQINEDQVTIDGTTSTIQEKRNIGFLVGQVPGVRFVINNLEINNNDKRLIDELNKLRLSFNVNETKISEENRKLVEPFLPLLKNEKNYHLVISGFSDNSGPTTSQLKVSEKRAKAVEDYLVARGIDKSKIETKFFSFSKNTSLGDRNLERRVEFIFEKGK